MNVQDLEPDEGYTLNKVTDAQKATWPFNQVVKLCTLEIKPGGAKWGEQFRGGSGFIVGRKEILTAAHCVMKGLEAGGEHKGAYLPSLDVKVLYPEKYRAIDVEELIFPIELWTTLTANPVGSQVAVFDFALLKTKSNLDVITEAQPIPLAPSQSPPDLGTAANPLGYIGAQIPFAAIGSGIAAGDLVSATGQWVNRQYPAEVATLVGKGMSGGPIMYAGGSKPPIPVEYTDAGSLVSYANSLDTEIGPAVSNFYPRIRNWIAGEIYDSSVVYKTNRLGKFNMPVFTPPPTTTPGT